MQEDLPLIVLRGLEGNEPTSLTSFQLWLLPYVPTIISVLWVLWWAILIIVLAKYMFDFDIISRVRDVFRKRSRG